MSCQSVETPSTRRWNGATLTHSVARECQRMLPDDRCPLCRARQRSAGVEARRASEDCQGFAEARWAHYERHDFTHGVSFQGARWPQDAFCTAASVAPIEMLKYMRNDGCDDPHPQLALMHAAGNNRREVLEWLLAEFGSMYALRPRVAWAAARHGHIELLKWLRERGCPWDNSVALAAVQHAITDGSMRPLRWVAANGGHIFHREVRLDLLRRHLKHRPTGPLPDQLVPDAMWVHALIRWRKVKLLVRKWEIALAARGAEAERAPVVVGVRAQRKRA